MKVRGIDASPSERLFHKLAINVIGGVALSGASKPAGSQLMDLALSYFKKEGYKVKSEAVSLDGFSGVTRYFDLIVQKGKDEQVVWVRDWNRTIGVNILISLDTASSDVGLANPIMIGEKFSDHAKSYSNRRKIMLLTRQKMISSLR
ncbi:MAG: hypothetical protein ACQXXJ_01470 [Candidatus Bathyarchaeia archaeon]|jgi:hypothetical protein